MNITAIYPGTFDPISLGHTDLVHRAARLFDHVIVGVAYSYQKSTLFSLDERVSMTQHVLADIPNLQVLSFDGLLINFAQEQSASVLLRGMRAVSDFEFEFHIYEKEGLWKDKFKEIKSFAKPEDEVLELEYIIFTFPYDLNTGKYYFDVIVIGKEGIGKARKIFVIKI